MIKNSVCRFCEERKVGCHGTCELYIREKETRDAIKEDNCRKRDAEKVAEDVLFSNARGIGKRLIERRQKKRRWY